MTSTITTSPTGVVSVTGLTQSGSGGTIALNVKHSALAVGFTGTRQGMTKEQHLSLGQFLEAMAIGNSKGRPLFHHGDCIGADFEAASLAAEVGFWVVAHPGPDPRMRGNHPSDGKWDPAPFMERNRTIVRLSHILLAAPLRSVEESRGGTWATVRMARGIDKASWIFQPNGYVRLHSHSKTGTGDTE